MALPSQCPLCTASTDLQEVVTAHVYGHGEKRAVYKCSQCDIRYLFPGLNKEDEARFYAKEFEKFMEVRSADGAGWEKPTEHINANEKERTRRLGHLQQWIKPNSDILEVGCSSGFMLYPLVEQGHHCVGVEPSGIFSDFVRMKGLKCYSSVDECIEKHDVSQGFDLILHYYVMEHVADPLAFLKQQIDLLKPGGRLVFELPNANDALATFLDIPQYERFIWVVSHRWYFSENALSHLLNKFDGKNDVLLDQRYDLSNHMVWARDGKPGGMDRFTDVWGSELEEQYKHALIKAGKCDTVIGTYVKPG